MPKKRRCQNCGYYIETKQQHPYGSTTATEYLGDCAVDADNTWGEPCPSWRHYQEIEEESDNA